MQIDIRYQPAYSLAIVRLDVNEAIQVESGAMVSMSSNLSLETAMKGGLLGALKRKVLGGESLFANTFKAEGGPAEITLAPSIPGDVTHIPLRDETLYIQSGSFLAGHPSIALDTQWGGARTFFGGEGLFLLKATGTGDVLVSSYGAIHKVPITSGRPYICDTGHVVAFTEGLDYKVRPVAGIKSLLFSGEGLVCEFRGRGQLLVQTRNPSSPGTSQPFPTS